MSKKEEIIVCGKFSVKKELLSKSYEEVKKVFPNVRDELLLGAWEQVNGKLKKEKK